MNQSGTQIMAYFPLRKFAFSVLQSIPSKFSSKAPRLEGYEKEITLEWAKFTHSAYSEEVRLKVCNQLPGRSDVNIDGYEMSPLMKKALALNNELTTYGGDVFEYDEITSMQDVIRNH